MRKTRTIFLAGALTFCLVGISSAAEQKMLADIPSTDRVIAYHLHDIPVIHVGIRYVTVLSLPEGEKIAGIFVGDSDNWTIQHAESIVTVKAGGIGIRTNLNIVAESGNSYNFLLEEVSHKPGEQVDISVRLNNSDSGMASAVKAKPQFVSYDELEKAKAAEATAVAALQREKSNMRIEAKKDLENAQIQAANDIRHDFTWKGNKQSKDFGLKAIYTLNGFTYFEAHPQEAFAIYETKDKADSLVQYSMSPDGRYVVPKVINDGYLKVGKSKIEFHRSDSNG